MHFPRSCLHCETPACVTVCPTGASYKRADDGIVLVNPDTCIGCKLCSWACPYGAREYDYDDGVMKKCTLCVDRIYNETFAPRGSRAGLRARLPDRRAAFRRSRRSRQRGVAAGRGARRLRSAAGDRLQAGQQVSAAAAAPRPAIPRRRRRPPSSPWPTPVRWPTASSPGPTRPWRAELDMHPAYSVIVFTTASGAGYGLLIWLALARRIGSGAARSGAGIFRSRRGAGADHHRAARLDCPSRPAGARLARAVAMEDVVAVA